MAGLSIHDYLQKKPGLKVVKALSDYGLDAS
jgi:hypothetical protein